jgi:hypothetical protein
VLLSFQFTQLPATLSLGSVPRPQSCYPSPASYLRSLSRPSVFSGPPACPGPPKRQEQREAHPPRLLHPRLQDTGRQLPALRHSSRLACPEDTQPPTSRPCRPAPTPNTARPRARTPTAAGVGASAAWRPWATRMPGSETALSSRASELCRRRSVKAKVKEKEEECVCVRACVRACVCVRVHHDSPSNSIAQLPPPPSVHVSALVADGRASLTSMSIE